jgi:hypothetical protein
MPAHNQVVVLRPRSLANVLLDLTDARRDWAQALADAERAGREGDEQLEAECGDRMSEADTRIDDLRGEFTQRFREATGLTWRQIEKAVEEMVL